MLKLTSIDKQLLDELQRNCKTPNNILAEKIGMSTSTCLRKVRLLEQVGVVERYVAVINPLKVGLNITLYARVWLKSQDAKTVNNFSNEVRLLPEVVECHLMAGDCDYLLRIITKDLNAYKLFLMQHLTCIDGVQSIKTDIPIQLIKSTHAVPLNITN